MGASAGFTAAAVAALAAAWAAAGVASGQIASERVGARPTFASSPDPSSVTAGFDLPEGNGGGDLVLDYNVIQSTGKFCPGRDSCRVTSRNHRGPDGVELDWKRRNCFCDRDCAVYGDCCIDAPAYEPAQQQEAHKRFGCLNLKQYGDVYISDKCPDGWGLPNIRQACERPDEVRPDRDFDRNLNVVTFVLLLQHV